MKESKDQKNGWSCFILISSNKPTLSSAFIQCVFFAVFDIYSKFVPQPVEIKTDSVYEYYDILEEIGTGAFGVVHRCRERKTGNIFAAKFIPVSHNMEKELIRKEIDIMNQLHHSKLINLHDAFEDDDEMVLIFELWV